MKKSEDREMTILKWGINCDFLVRINQGEQVDHVAV